MKSCVHFPLVSREQEVCGCWLKKGDAGRIFLLFIDLMNIQNKVWSVNKAVDASASCLYLWVPSLGLCFDLENLSPPLVIFYIYVVN